MLVVDSHNELQEAPRSSFPPQPKPIRAAANIISYIFHPLFVLSIFFVCGVEIVFKLVYEGVGL